MSADLDALLISLYVLIDDLLPTRRRFGRPAARTAAGGESVGPAGGQSAVHRSFGKGGRAWLERVELPLDERQTLEGCLRQLDFLAGELTIVERAIAEAGLASPEIQRLMAIPGVDVTTAATLVALIGDFSRFPSSRRLVGYLGLHPRIRQSGSGPARHGHTSKEGSRSSPARPCRSGLGRGAFARPVRAFATRTTARRGRNIATVAVARKLAVLAWQLLTTGEDYAFQRPALVRRKLPRLELKAGAPRAKRQPGGPAVWGTDPATYDAPKMRAGVAACETWRG